MLGMIRSELEFAPPPSCSRTSTRSWSGCRARARWPATPSRSGTSRAASSRPGWRPDGDRRRYRIRPHLALRVRPQVAASFNEARLTPSQTPWQSPLESTCRSTRRRGTTATPTTGAPRSASSRPTAAPRARGRAHAAWSRSTPPVRPQPARLTLGRTCATRRVRDELVEFLTQTPATDAAGPSWPSWPSEHRRAITTRRGRAGGSARRARRR